MELIRLCVEYQNRGWFQDPDYAMQVIKRLVLVDNNNSIVYLVIKQDFSLISPIWPVLLTII